MLQLSINKRGKTLMRLWRIDLIPYLPRTQLLAQWRELNSIFKITLQMNLSLV